MEQRQIVPSHLYCKLVIVPKRKGKKLNIMWQTACLAFYPIMIDSNAALFSCTAVDQVSDSMTAMI